VIWPTEQTAIVHRAILVKRPDANRFLTVVNGMGIPATFPEGRILWVETLKNLGDPKP
jgi:hypothetical protein